MMNRNIGNVRVTYTEPARCSFVLHGIRYRGERRQLGQKQMQSWQVVDTRTNTIVVERMGLSDAIAFLTGRETR